MVSLSKYLIVLYSTFHLKEALYSFSLACLNCQHHYSCLWGHYEGFLEENTVIPEQ